MRWGLSLQKASSYRWHAIHQITSQQVGYLLYSFSVENHDGRCIIFLYKAGILCKEIIFVYKHLLKINTWKKFVNIKQGNLGNVTRYFYTNIVFFQIRYEVYYESKHIPSLSNNNDPFFLMDNNNEIFYLRNLISVVDKYTYLCLYFTSQLFKKTET